MNKIFAKHISEVLEGMDYKVAKQIMLSLVDGKCVMLHDTHKSSKKEDGKMRFTSKIEILDGENIFVGKRPINLLKEYGIEAFYYILEINPTEKELIRFMERHTPNHQTEDLIGSVYEEIFKQLEDFKFDEVKFYFMDSKVEWDVIVEWDGSYYTAGSDELKYE